MRALLVGAATRYARLRTPALTVGARESSNLARIKEVRPIQLVGCCAILTLQLLLQLRERSGAPMHEVKSALVATSWDIGAPRARSGALHTLSPENVLVASRCCYGGAPFTRTPGSLEEGAT